MSDYDEVIRWMAEFLCEKLELSREQIDTTLTFDRYGLDSVTATCLVADLAELVGKDLDPSIVYDHPTIEALARFVVSDVPLTQECNA